MVYHYIEIVYGVLVTIGDLEKLGYIKLDDNIYRIHEFSVNNIEGLSYVPAWHHSWEEEMDAHPERFSASYQKYMEMKESPEIEEETEDFPHKYSTICVCVTIGSIGIGRRGESKLPTLEQLNKAAQKFKELAPKELLDLAGPEALHFIPDDCICCN